MHHRADENTWQSWLISNSETKQVKNFQSKEYHAKKLSRQSAWIVFTTNMRQECVNSFCNINMKSFWTVSKMFAQSFCSHAMFIMGHMVGTFDIVWKLSRLSTIFQTVQKLFTLLETLQTVWKLSTLSGNSQDCQKFSRLSGNSPDCLETFHILWKLSRLSGNFPDSPATFQTVWKLSRLSGNF